MRYGLLTKSNHLAHLSRPPHHGLVTRLIVLDMAFTALIVMVYGLILKRPPFYIFRFHPSIIVLILMLPICLYMCEMYDINRNWRSMGVVLRIFAALAGSIIVYGVIHFVVCGPDEVLGLMPVVMGGMSVEVLAARRITEARVRKKNQQSRALVVGAGWSGKLAIDTVLSKPELRLKVVGIIDDSIRNKNYSYRGVPVVGNRRSLKEKVDRFGATIIILAISHFKNAELIKVLLSLKMQGIEVLGMPEFYERVTGQVPIKHVEDQWFLHNGGFDTPRRPVLQAVKRFLDITAASAGILISLPLIGIIALLVKIDSRGPVFVGEERVGLNERPFFLIKFRSMRPGHGEYCITRVGRWLRRTKLDEIPQLINILKADLSFIGPRPERPVFVSKLKESIPYFSMRFNVKPGLSGWAQVNDHYGVSARDAIENLKYDLYYIQNMSCRLDLLILLKTIKIVLFARGR